MSSFDAPTGQLPSTLAPKEMARTQFIRHFGDMLKSLAEVFPEHSVLNEKHIKFRIGIQMLGDADERKKNEEGLLETFHTQLGDHFDALMAHDEKILDVLEESESLKFISDVFKDADTDTREVIWQYVDLLVQHSVCYEMYRKIPDKLTNSLTAISQKVQENGEAFDVGSLSSEILKTVDPAEMQAFALNMMSDEKTISSLCRIASGQLKQGAPAPAGGPPIIEAVEDGARKEAAIETREADM
tara:strand:- start:15840 stop:16568 length:729 start_codon:yes stop_codon:yes gene_type:complete